MPLTNETAIEIAQLRKASAEDRSHMHLHARMCLDLAEELETVECQLGAARDLCNAYHADAAGAEARIERALDKVEVERAAARSFLASIDAHDESDRRRSVVVTAIGSYVEVERILGGSCRAAWPAREEPADGN